jgi:carbon monoxide dehydrogenase subunit G
MYRFTESVPVDRPATEIWARLIDFPNIPAWEDGVLEVRQTSPGRPGIGTTFFARRVLGGREYDLDCRITDWQDDRSVTMEIRGGPLRRAFVGYAVEPTSESTSLVTYSTEGELRRPFGWLAPLIPVMGRRLIRSNIATLERMIEGAAAEALGERGA